MQKLVEQIEHPHRLVQRGHVSRAADSGPREVVRRVVNGSVAADLAVDRPWVPMLRLTHTRAAFSESTREREKKRARERKGERASARASERARER